MTRATAGAPGAEATPLEGTVALEAVDAASAQTWNWLAINETELRVPKAPEGAGASLPLWAKDVRLACGADAEKWISRCTEAPIVIEAKGAEPTGAAKPRGAVVRPGAPDGETVSTVALKAEAGAEGFAVVDAVGASGTTASALRLVALEGASLEVDVLIARQGEAQHLQAIGATLAEDASIAIRIWVLGGAKTALSVASDLVGDRSSFSSELRYLAGADESVDVTYDVRQLGRQTEARIGASGVLAEGASKTLRASIDLVRGCKGSHGSEAETVLVAGEHVTNKTLPVILCSEDDVQGDHGATIGSLSPEQMGFLRSRGLSERDVVSLASQAIVDDAASRLDADLSTDVVGWARDVWGGEASKSAADAAAMVHGTICDVPSCVTSMASLTGLSDEGEG